MPAKRPTARQRATLADWLDLQRLLVERTADYVGKIGELTAEGSLEPREYVERSTKFWADMIGDVGDWLQPAGAPRTQSAAVLPRHRATVARRLQSQPLPVAIPFTLFGSLDANESFRPVIDRFTRRPKPGASRRPALVLEPRQHFSLSPQEVNRSTRRRVELKLYNLPDNLVSGDLYEGILWIETVATGKGARKRKRLAVIELEIA